MGDKTSDLVDIVVFFDANMPKMDQCSANCSGKKLVFCKHRFNFNACLIRQSKSISGLNDFNVVRYFFNLIKNSQLDSKSRPLFILVTRDYNFIEDARLDYFEELQNDTANTQLVFTKKSINCGDLELIIVTIRHKPCGADRDDDLRDMIEKLNRFWSERNTP